MEGTLTLREAGKKLGVKRRLLKRMIREGSLPEAKKVSFEKGPAWVIPESALEDLATREDILIDLAGEQPKVGFVETPPNLNADSPSGSLTEAQDSSKADKAKSGPPMPESADMASGQATKIAKTIQSGLVSGSSVDSNLIQFRKQAGKELDEHRAKQSQHQEGARVSDLGALLPHKQGQPPASWTSSLVSTNGAANSDSQRSKANKQQVEALDLALLDRLLVMQAEKAAIASKAEHSIEALELLNQTHTKTADELAVERRERSITADRFREERLARAVADAKVAELRDRVSRETEHAKAERKAREAALAKIVEAEKQAATALASMGWLSRRRYERLHKPKRG